jgi:branched-chain amino acid transport system permease protein
VLGALRQNPTRVEALGYRPFGYRLVATLISGAICAVAGVLLANQSEFVSPAFMTWRRSGELLVMVILGGIGSLWGAILGAIGYLLLDEFLSTFTEQGKLILGPLLILAAIAGRGARFGAAARASRA